MNNPPSDSRASTEYDDQNPFTDNHLRFFEAAEPLFERFGFKKTTVEDVCRAAGMSKRTFYDLFNDKQDLLLKLMESVVNRATGEWEASLPPNLDPLSRLHSLLDFYAAMVREHQFMGVFVEDFNIMRQFVSKTDEIRLTRVGGTLDNILREGVAVGQFKAIDRRAAIWLVFGLLDTIYLLVPRLVDTPGPLDDPVMADETRRFVVRGLGAVEEAEST